MFCMISNVNAEVIDLEGQTVGKLSGSDFKNSYAGNTIINGTVQVGSLAEAVGVYTIGDGAVVTCGDQQYINGDCTFNIVEDGEYKQTGSYFVYPFRYGQVKLIMNGGKFTSTSTASALSRGGMVNFGYVWNNKSSSKGKDVSAVVVMTNRSELSISSGNLQLGSVKSNNEAGSPVKTSKTDLFVTNSIIKCEKGQIVLACSVDKWLSDWNNSYVRAVFGPNSEITTGQFYVNGQYPQSSVIFDGATIHWAGNNTSFIGHTTAVGDVYTIDSLGLTIDIPSGKSLTCDSNASSLKGEGGITKIGEGSITWNKVSSNGSTGMTFTGPLVVSNGTWTSTLSYAATKFAVDGANSTLALSGTLTAAAPDFSITAGGTLDLTSEEPKDRTAGTLTFGENAVLKLNGGAMGVDSFSATSLDLAATAANPVKIEFTDAATISGGAYTLVAITGGGTFAAGDETKFALDANAPEGSTLSVSGSALVLNVPVTNPATWTGNALDGKFSTPGNWLGNAVPGADDEIEIKATAEVELDCDLAIAVKSLSIHSDSAKVTIGGSGAIAVSGNIVNASEFRPVVNVPVEFKSGEDYAPIDVTGEVEFSGGVKGTVPANHSTFYGNYTLTQGTWSLSSAITLAANATVTATGTTIETSGTSLLNAEAGSTLTINRLTLNASGNIFGTFAGNLTVHYIYQYNHGGVTFNSGFSGVLRVNGIHHHSGGYVRDFAFTPAKTATIIFGSGSCGIEMQRGYFKVNGYTFHSVGDWQFDITNSNYGGEDGAGRTVIGANGLVVDTADYDDPTASGHTVSVNNTGSKSTNALTGTGGLGVAGNGTFAFNKQGKFTGGLVASNSVTVAVKSGVYPGKGDVTFRDTATFDLVQSGSGTVPVSGTLTMAGGTTIRIPELTGGVLPLSVNALAFESVTAENKVALNIEGGELVPGFNAIIQSATALPANAWDNFAVTLGATVPSGMETLYIAQGNTLYILVKGGSDAIWSGGGMSGNFNNSDNWLGGQIPGNGSCVQIAAADEATLVNDIPGFSPASITFAAGSTAVTITGENAINVTSITNLSSASHTINVPVYFTGDIQVKQAAMAETGDLSKAHVTFAGGAHAAEGFAIENGDFTAVYSRCMFGDYYLYPTTENPWTALYQGNGKRLCLADNSTLHITHTKHMTELYVGANAKVYAGNTILDGRLMYNMAAGGEMIITNMTLSGTGDRYLTYGQGTSTPGVFKFDGVINSKSANWFYFADQKEAAKHTIYIGAGGLSLDGASGSGAYCIGRNNDGNAETIRPWYSDFTIGARSTDTYALVLYRDVTFNTDDESGVGRTITLNGCPKFDKTPTFTVAGSGTVLVNSAEKNNTQPPVTVTDTATLAFKPGASLTTDNITVNSGATLAVAGSGTFALGGGLTLADGACLGFNYSTRNAPVLDLTDKNVTLGDNKNIVVKITSENGKRAKSGKNVLTSGGNFAGAKVTLAEGAPDWVGGISVDETTGNIVLDVKPKGLVFRIN